MGFKHKIGCQRITTLKGKLKIYWDKRKKRVGFLKILEKEYVPKKISLLNVKNNNWLRNGEEKSETFYGIRNSWKSEFRNPFYMINFSNFYFCPTILSIFSLHQNVWRKKRGVEPFVTLEKN